MPQKDYKPFCLEVEGDYACFTRPEMKVERVSYDVITPSAARAVFEAIFWKPAIWWRIKKIEVLKPIKWISVRRNEVGAVMSDRSTGLFVEDARQQRAGLFLRDVKYRLHAMLEYIPVKHRKELKYMPVSQHLWAPDEKNGLAAEIVAWKNREDTVKADETPGKYLAMFERRAKKGQCFNQPYLGCREFSCSFRLINDVGVEPTPINETREFGYMLYDMDYTDINDPKPAFFRAKLENGVVIVPDWESEEVKK